MNLNQYIDHTLLKPEASEEQIKKLCTEAKQHLFKAVCINTYYVPIVYRELKDSDVKICTVVGFPLGMSPTQVKLTETKWAIEQGADEIDMVIAIGALKDKRDEYVLEDIKTIAEYCHQHQVLLKVIIETCLLNQEEKERACRISVNAGADFVKTSTGFSTGGATLEDIRLMKKVVGERCQIKASGGVKSKDIALALIEAGANRLGTSSGVALMSGQSSSQGY